MFEVGGAVKIANKSKPAYISQILNVKDVFNPVEAFTQLNHTA